MMNKDNMSTAVNPFGESREIAMVESQSLGQTAIAVREKAMVEAAMAVAHARPRNEQKAMERIRVECGNLELAENAEYLFSRGGTEIRGASIDLVRTIATHWGNMQYGWDVLSERPGETLVEAYAWDMETNLRRPLRFTVKHKRKTQSGEYALTDERDIYEHMANLASRRVRRCLEDVLSRIVVATAVQWCEETIARKLGPKEVQIEKMLRVYAEIGVDRRYLEKKAGKSLEKLQQPEIGRLRKVYSALKNGLTTVTEQFPDAQGAEQGRFRDEGGRQPARNATEPFPGPAHKDTDVETSPAAQGDGQPEEKTSAAAEDDAPLPVETFQSMGRYEAVPAGCVRRPSWPDGLFFRPDPRGWFDGEGTEFDRDQHAWSSAEKRPSMKRDETFGARRHRAGPENRPAPTSGALKGGGAGSSEKAPEDGSPAAADQGGVPTDAVGREDWPDGLSFSQSRKVFYDAAGNEFKGDRHTWDNEKNLPAVDSQGRFEPRPPRRREPDINNPYRKAKDG